MTEWRDVALGEGLEIHHGFAFKGAHFRDDGDLIVLTPGNFFDEGGFKPKSGKEKYYDGRFPPKFLLGAGDVVVAMTEQVQGLLGSTATIPDDGVYLHNQRIGLLKVTDPDLIDLRFAYHLMNTSGVRHQLQATVTGAKIRHTAPGRIRDVRVALPGVETQRRVAGVLDALDDLIENNRRRVEVLEEMTRAIYREWFVHFRYPGHEDATFVDSPLGPIPEGWEPGVVDQIVELVKTTADPITVDPGTPAVGLEHIPRRQLTLDSWGVAEGLGSRKAVFSSGDLLFGKIRPYFHKVCIAPVDGICSTDAIVLRPVDAHWGLAALAVSSDDFVANATQTSNGTKMPRADWRVIKEFPVAIPPGGISECFTELAHASLGDAQVLMFQNRQLASLRDLLLPRLVTGRIDVSSVDLDAVIAVG